MYIQDLASTRVVPLRKVPTKDKLAYLQTVYYNIRAVMQHDCHVQLAHLAHAQVACLQRDIFRAVLRQPRSPLLTVVALHVARHDGEATRSQPHMLVRVVSLHGRLRSRFFTTAVKLKPLSTSIGGDEPPSAHESRRHAMRRSRRADTNSFHC